MGYTVNSGQFAGRYSGCEDVDLTYPGGSLVAASTGAVVGPVVELGGPKPCRLTLEVSSVSASDSLDCIIQGSDSNDFSTSGEYRTLATFTQNTAASKQTLSFVGARFIRAQYSLTGTTITVAATLKGEVAF